MVIFCSDLDNTLIYSYKQQIGPLKKCVEVYEGREISFMTSCSIQLLKQLNRMLSFVPVTTRTVEQYERIRLETGPPQYALAANGGILLVNGAADQAWYEESMAFAAECAAELKGAFKLLEEDRSRCFEIRNIHELFLFTKSGEPEKTVDYLKRNLDLGLVDVFSNGAKVYVLPGKLNKGKALKRLRERLGDCVIIAAGDSEFDIPMLLEADYGFLPQKLSPKIELKAHMTVCGEQKAFSDEMLEKIMEGMKEKGELRA